MAVFGHGRHQVTSASVTTVYWSTIHVGFDEFDPVDSVDAGAAPDTVDCNWLVSWAEVVRRVVGFT